VVLATPEANEKKPSLGFGRYCGASRRVRPHPRSPFIRQASPQFLSHRAPCLPAALPRSAARPVGCGGSHHTTFIPVCPELSRCSAEGITIHRGALGDANHGRGGLKGAARSRSLQSPQRPLSATGVRRGQDMSLSDRGRAGAFYNTLPAVLLGAIVNEMPSRPDQTFDTFRERTASGTPYLSPAVRTTTRVFNPRPSGFSYAT
jgi:hypothetical protein